MTRLRIEKLPPLLTLLLIMPLVAVALLMFAGFGSPPVSAPPPPPPVTTPPPQDCAVGPINCAGPGNTPTTPVPSDNPPVTTALVECTIGANDWCVSDAQVTLTAVDDLGVQATYWSLDSGSWVRYTGAITVTQEGWHELCFYSVDSTHHREATKCTRFKIDKTAPIITIRNPKPIQYWHTSDTELLVYVADSISGVNNVRIYVDGNLVPNGTLLKMSELGLGAHKIYVVAWDNAGNKSEERLHFYVVRRPPIDDGCDCDTTTRLGPTIKAPASW